MNFIPRIKVFCWLAWACFFPLSADVFAVSGNNMDTNRIAVNGIVPVVVQVEGGAEDSLNARVTALETRMTEFGPWVARTDVVQRRDALEAAIKEIEQSCRVQISLAEWSLKDDYEKAYGCLRDCQEKGEKHLDRWLSIFAGLVGVLPIGIALIQWLAGQWRFRLYKQDIHRAKKDIQTANKHIQQSKDELQQAKIDFHATIGQLNTEKEREIRQLTRDGAESLYMSFSTLILMTDVIEQASMGRQSQIDFMIILIPTIICFHKLIKQGLMARDEAIIQRVVDGVTPFVSRWRESGRGHIWMPSLSGARKAIVQADGGTGWDKDACADLLGEHSSAFLWLKRFYEEMEEAAASMQDLPLVGCSSEEPCSAMGASNDV